MKVNEMRIGNWYDENGSTKQVNPNTIEAVWVAERIWCKPIPLTEEWLLKFGFQKDSLNIYRKYLNIHRGVSYFECYLGGITVEVQFIHQLQNLYFALKGEELEIKN